MSDMIWNGSYTLGNSQETQITAGTGIEVTTPAAGQIQIAADETVLFNSSTATTSGSLSEAITNFERIRIYGNRTGSSATNNLPAYTEVILRDGVPLGFVLTSAIYADKIYMPVMVYSLTSTTFSLTSGSILFMTTTPTVMTNQTNVGVLRIVGINRISGGN